MKELLYTRNCEIKPGISLPEGMQRWALGLEYNGSQYHGFQKQASASQTVQAALEQALTRVANETITTVCAGRTDAGVHSVEQVVHFDTLSDRPIKAWVEGTNTHLPETIRVLWALPVAETFHARFSATDRQYRYLTLYRPTKPALLHDQVTWTKYQLDVHLMQQAASYFVGEHDFTSLRSTQCQARSPVRNISYLTIERCGELIVTDVKANAFLHHMVRNIMGVLIDIGRGAKPVTWAEEVLVAKDRRCASVTAPAQGLYLVKVGYPKRFNLPRGFIGPWFLRP